MERPSRPSSYLEQSIERETRTVRQIQIMPYGGYKNTRVVEKKITLARIPRGSSDPDPDT